ncbi:MAG: Sensory box histidine kinase [Marinimicrobia bacterium 46_47]|nr:MAG: Sensory box histidine kinase [Marinimicrobia bacterium 46_47]KUK93683.1 MAG: Sensory box histidine kinase [Marinimicrobia bacterium 46_43]
MDEREKNRVNAGEAKFHQVWQCALDGMRLTDGNGIIRDVNPAFSELVHLPGESLIGKPLSVIYQKEASRIMQKYCERFKTRTILPHVVNQYVLHDGTVRWFEVYNTFVEIPGEPEQVLSIFRDKTELVKATDKLKESETRLNIAVQSARIGLWDQDFKTGIIVRNNTWAEMLGYESKEIQKDKNAFLNLIHPNDRDKTSRIIQKHEAGQTDFFRIEHRLRCADGSWKWILNVGQIVERDESGKPLRAAGVHVDIDEQKKTEESLKQSEKLLHSVWDQSKDGMRLTDARGRIVMVNDAFSEMMGMPKEKLEGQFLGVIYYPEEQDRIVKRYKENFLNKTIQPYIARPFTLWNGEQKWFGVSIAFISDTLLLSVFRDITQQVRSQESLRELVHQKEMLMRELQHRVKNNMNIIASLISLEMRQIRDPDIRGIFLDIRNRIHSMAAIYERLSLTGDPESVELNQYIQTLAENILKTFTVGSNRLHLKTFLDPVRLDTKRAASLGLILNELLTNSLKYAYPNHEKGTITIEIRQTDNQIRFVVKDDGIGLPDDFSPGKEKSMGFMLIKTLVSQLKGKMTIDGGQGTQTTIEFPV